MRPDDLIDRFEIDPTAAKYPLTLDHDPVLTSGPAPPEFADDARLDPKRATATPEGPRLARRPRVLPFGLLGSLAIHLLPLLVLVDWTGTPAQIAAPIPVQLVIEQPPPAPPLPPKSQTPKMPGRLASTDIGDPAASPDRPASAPSPIDERQDQPVAAPASKPSPPQELVSALPTPAPPPGPAVAPPRPDPMPDLNPPTRQAVATGVLPNLRATHPAPHPGRIPGPAATRDEYLAYCMSLIRGFYGMLPASFIAGRSGRTILSLVVLDDGSIARVAVRQSSGYPDIDSRVAQMVSAVRRFPPLPQWTQARSITLEYVQIFPDRLRGR